MVPRRGRGPILALRNFLAAVLLCLAAGAAAEHPTPAEPWRVVLIRNWDSQYPVNVVREKALREALLHDSPRVVDLYAEEIDPLRFYAPDIEEEFLVLLRKKYRERRIDVVIASGAEPLEFATRHRDDIWPGAAIVFNGVMDGTLDRKRLGPNTTGVTMVYDVRSTLALGLAMVPGARKVYLVAGDAPFDRVFLNHAMSEVARFEPPLQARPLVGLKRGELIEEISRVEPEALVLYLTVLRDRHGQVYPPGSTIVEEVAAGSAAPVLSAAWLHLSRGPLGGYSASVQAHGRAAGQLARTILEGARAERLPIRADPAAECRVDWHALRRWDLSEQALPAGCKVVNQAPTLWTQYFWPFIALVSVILLQGALIWSLVLQSRRRRVAEHRLHERNAEMARVARLSMVGALTASIAHEINQPMGAILSNTDAAEMMLDQGTLDVTKLREILHDIRSEDMRASEVIAGLRRLLGRREANVAALELNAEVADALRHLAFDAVRRGVQLMPSFDPQVPPVLADSVQLQQVIVNLVMNAMDAVVAEPGAAREVRVETHAKRGGAEIVVSDLGPGIPPDKASRVFDAIFTTKKEGMGMGLSIVRNIVESAGGRVSYEPNVPHGAVFRVWLPAIGT